MMGFLLVALLILRWLLFLLAGVAGVILFLVLLLLTVPFGYEATGHREEADTWLAARFTWLFGGLSLVFTYARETGFVTRLRLLGRFTMGMPTGKGSEANKRKRKPKEAGKKHAGGIRMNREKLRYLIPAVLRLLDRILPGRLFVDGRFGLEDPGDTGMLCAVLAPLRALPPARGREISITLEPVFDEAVLAGHLETEGRIVLWFIAWEALKLAISRPFRQDIFHRNRKGTARRSGRAAPIAP